MSSQVSTYKKKKKVNFGVADVIIITVLILFALVTVYPFYYTIVGSFSDGKDFELGGVWLFPRVFTLDNYIAVLKDHRLWIALKNTILRTVIGTVATLLYTSVAAYAFSQKDLPFKKFFRAFNVAAMFFSGGIIPFFLLVNIIGLYDNFLVYIIPSLYSVTNMIVMSNFFSEINPGIREAALIDGADEIEIWWHIYIPMSTPVLSTVALWIIVMHWNSYLPTLLYTNKDESMWTLQYYLMRIIKDASSTDSSDAALRTVTSKTIQFAAMVVSIVPILFVYPLIQRNFIGGKNSGSIKE